MILQYWQIEFAAKAAKTQRPHTLVGSRVNYQFCHETAPGVYNGICGLLAWVYEHHNPDASELEPMSLTLAFDTWQEGFFVTQEGIKAAFSREQLAGDSTTINQHDRSNHIDDVVLGEPDGDQHSDSP